MTETPYNLRPISPERRDALRRRVQQLLRQKRQEREAEQPVEPRYDGVFFRGTAWLDRLSSEDVWDE